MDPNNELTPGEWLLCIRDHDCRHARPRNGATHQVKKGSLWQVAYLEPGGVLLDAHQLPVTIAVTQRDLVNWERH